MTRTRIALLSTTALATLLGAALPAMAQAPMPAPMYAPAPPPAPMMAPAPMPMQEPMPVVPASPMMAAAPRAADDMTGSVGFGVGVVGGATGTATGTSTATSLVSADTTKVAMKYWVSDSLSLLPSLDFRIGKVKGQDASWYFAPGVLAMFNLLKGASTRFDAGVGVGLALGKTPPAQDTTIGLRIPVALNVEHFFTRWFSMGIGTQFNLIDFGKTGDNWNLNLEVSNIRYMGTLFFYTD